MEQQDRKHPASHTKEQPGEIVDQGLERDSCCQGLRKAGVETLPCGTQVKWVRTVGLDELRWSDVFRQLVGEFKVDFATTLNYRPQ